MNLNKNRAFIVNRTWVLWKQPGSCESNLDPVEATWVLWKQPGSCGSKSKQSSSARQILSCL
ncbi:hypothetical protein DPMN_187510 [Dreissena polymorpha]|uniref:Uncharacterized protein n=1 Tax=Dreissena polymorpha TaxID=45954 RepID=A0A9D4DS93_DREPO|nr:hypothetical protein DPMN_187510 [Dreissena polymorpha]